MLSETAPDDFEKFSAPINMGTHTSSLADIINLAENLEHFEFYPDIENEDDLSRYYEEDLPEGNRTGSVFTLLFSRVLWYDINVFERMVAGWKY